MSGSDVVIVSARRTPIGAFLGALSPLSAVQLGITLTSLALGALGESTLAAIIRSLLPATADSRVTLLVHAAALAIAFAMLSALHVDLRNLPDTVYGYVPCQAVGGAAAFLGRSAILVPSLRRLHSTNLIIFPTNLAQGDVCEVIVPGDAGGEG